MNKLEFVPAYFQPVGKSVPTGKKDKGFFGAKVNETAVVDEWEQTVYSDSLVDGERLSEDIAKVVMRLRFLQDCI